MRNAFPRKKWFTLLQGLWGWRWWWSLSTNGVCMLRSSMLCVRGKHRDMMDLTKPQSAFLSQILFQWSSRLWCYSGPCDLRPPIQPAKYGLKLKVVLKWKDIHIENIRIVLLIAGLKMEGIVKWKVLKSRGLLYLIAEYKNRILSAERMEIFGYVLPHILSNIDPW